VSLCVFRAPLPQKLDNQYRIKQPDEPILEHQDPILTIKNLLKIPILVPISSFSLQVFSKITVLYFLKATLVAFYKPKNKLFFPKNFPLQSGAKT
jgi:hypothetical protein